MYVEENEGVRHVKSFIPTMDSEKGIEISVDLGSKEPRNILMHFPLYQRVDSLQIGIDKQASLEASQFGYLFDKPIVYYGSSITQGGCASTPGNAYPSIISRTINCDHVNLGFSGSCQAEEPIAHYIASLSMQAFVYDYDHNAPDVEYLKSTHERLFFILREKQPHLPVLFLSRPDFGKGTVEENIVRREVIHTTYKNARRQGDKNVYFLDGETLFRGFNEASCTVDGSHPTDLGFTRMGEKIGIQLAVILGVTI